MPRGDRTGPRGQGPMTGRAAGYGGGYSVPGYMNPGVGFGRGMGFGRGFGRGWGRGFGFWGCPFCGYDPPQTKKEAKKYYKEDIEATEEYLKEMKKALDELDKEK